MLKVRYGFLLMTSFYIELSKIQMIMKYYKKTYKHLNKVGKCMVNGSEFNIPKCNILQISTHLAKRNFTYKMSDIPLNTVLEHDYLGVCLHHKLSWRPYYVDCMCNKASRLLGFLKRNLYSSPAHIKEYLYKQLLLPSIEYCLAIWDPYHQTDIKKIEMVQHHAVRFVLNKSWHKSHNHDSVTEMLTNLGWP